MTPSEQTALILKNFGTDRKQWSSASIIVYGSVALALFGGNTTKELAQLETAMAELGWKPPVNPAAHPGAPGFDLASINAANAGVPAPGPAAFHPPAPVQVVNPAPGISLRTVTWGPANQSGRPIEQIRWGETAGYGIGAQALIGINQRFTIELYEASGAFEVDVTGTPGEIRPGSRSSPFDNRFPAFHFVAPDVSDSDFSALEPLAYRRCGAPDANGNLWINVCARQPLDAAGQPIYGAPDPATTFVFWLPGR